MKTSKIIKNGKVVAYQTNTRYEIGHTSYNKEAIQRIYKIKLRENSKQLQILVFSKNIAEKIVEGYSYSEKMIHKMGQIHQS